MICKFGATKKARNSTMLVECKKEIECLLKEPVNSLHPVLLMKGIAPLGYNYVIIPAFGKDTGFFIDSTTPVNAHLTELRCTVDGLATFRDELFTIKAFCEYAESNYNTMIPDPRLPITDSMEHINKTQPFPPYSADGAYVISFASKDSNGQMGMAMSMVTDDGGMRNFASALFNKDKLEALLQFYNNPLEMVISAVWMPIGAVFLANGTKVATLGDSDIAFSGSVARKVYQSAFNITIEPPYRAQLPDGSYTYADYRNIEPYTTYQVRLPGVGMVDLPMSTMIADGREAPVIRVNFVLSPLDGNIIYELRVKDSILMVCNGNLATVVPLASTAYNTAGAIGSYVGLLGSGGVAIASAVTGNVIGAIAGMAGMASTQYGIIQKNIQAKNTVSGSLGGFASSRFCEEVEVCIRRYLVSDNPSNIASSIGRPLFKAVTIGSLKGYAKFSGVHIRMYTSVDINDEMERLLEGGVIIE